MSPLSVTLLSIEDYAEGFRVLLNLEFDDAHPMVHQHRQFHAEEQAAVSAASTPDEFKAALEARHEALRAGTLHLPPQLVIVLTAKDEVGSEYRSWMENWNFQTEPVAESRGQYIFTPALPASSKQLRLELAAVEWRSHQRFVRPQDGPIPLLVHRDNGPEPFEIAI
jgi:hypothetical protein